MATKKRMTSQSETPLCSSPDACMLYFHPQQPVHQNIKKRPQHRPGHNKCHDQGKRCIPILDPLGIPVYDPFFPFPVIIPVEMTETQPDGKKDNKQQRGEHRQHQMLKIEQLIKSHATHLRCL